MRTDLLERHITDTIKEWQMKIGYQEESMGLYYPDVSLKGLLELGEDVPGDELDEALSVFAEEVRTRFGAVKISGDGGRYCIEIPPEGCRYVAEKIPDSDFLRKLLDVLDKKENDMAPVSRLFHEYAAQHGGSVLEEDREAEGLGRVFVFDKEETDPYVYCMEQDDFGITYHRFSRPDYAKLISNNKKERHDTQECIMCK